VKACNLLNAAYFLPLLWRDWLRPVPMTWAQSPGSPLAWAKLIAEREYRPQPLGTPAALE
jgi:hypothetical protein